MKKFSILALALGFLVVGCGSDEAAGPKFAAASGTITKAAATANLAQLQSGAALNFTTPNGNPGTRDDFYAACTTKDPVTTVDNDSDNVATQTRTYACSNITGDRNTYSQNGTSTTTDKDDNDAKAGWTYSYDITGGHEGEDWTYSGFWDLAKTATTFLYTSDYKGTNTQKRGDSYIGGGSFAHTITPTDMNDPFSGGGTMSFEGYYAYTFTVDSVVTNYVFKMTSTDLTYGASPCTNFFKTGSYTYTDASNNTIKVTHTNCTTRTAEYNGEAI